MIDAWGWEAATYWWSVPVEKSPITVDGRARRERESPAGAALSGGDGRRTNLMGWTGTGRARSGVKSSGRSWDLCRHCDLSQETIQLSGADRVEEDVSKVTNIRIVRDQGSHAHDFGQHRGRSRSGGRPRTPIVLPRTQRCSSSMRGLSVSPRYRRARDPGHRIYGRVRKVQLEVLIVSFFVFLCNWFSSSSTWLWHDT